jgi:hypothetical protein
LATAPATKGYAFHGIDCLPDLIEVNRQVLVTNASMGRCALTSLERTALGRPK